MTKELLSAENIIASIEPCHLPRLSKLDIFDTIESTNTYLLALAKSGPTGWACFAEQQTQGRGRLGRRWFSPHGTNIYCSLLWRFPREQDISGLSIAIGVMIANTLKQYGVTAGIQLKWPNDILFAGRKLSGILLERSGEAVIIGIGVNLELPNNSENTWIALSDITGKPIKRNHFAGLLMNELLAKCPLYQTQGLPAFLSEWRQHDFLIGKNITLHQSEKQISGIMQGINSAGELLLKNEEGILRSFRAGEASLKSI